MPELLIDIDPDQSVFVLTGDFTSLRRNRRAIMNLREFEGFTFDGNRLVIPYLASNREESLSRVRAYLQKFGYGEKRSNRIETILEKYYLSEESFQTFSENAAKIRNNQLDDVSTREFEEFTSVLLTAMPQRKLYALQLLSAYHLAFSINSCNFSVPGAGKTSMVYAAYAYLNSLPKADHRHVDCILVIGPLSSFGPWETEFEACFGRSANSKRLSGGVSLFKRRASLSMLTAPDLTLVSYQGVPSILKELKSYLQYHKAMVVLDEAHKIKNTEGGVIADAVLQLATDARARVVLTGTPAPNGYEDLYNLFKFIWPQKKIIGYQPYHLEDMSSNPRDPRIPQLVKNISPFFIRITKRDLGLPTPVEHEPIIVPMGEVQAEIYEYIEKSYMDYFQSNMGTSGVYNSLTKARLIRLMQVSTNPSLLRKPLEEIYSDDEFSQSTFVDDVSIMRKIMQYVEHETPAKFEVALKLVESLISRGEKVVVWATFVQNILDFQDYLRVQGIESRTFVESC